MALDHVATDLGGVACREVTRYAEPGPDSVDLACLDNLDGEAGCPDVVSPPATAHAIRIFGDGELRQLGRCECRAGSREHWHNGKRTHKAASSGAWHHLGGTDIHGHPWEPTTSGRFSRG